jgi:hypothetical protein
MVDPSHITDESSIFPHIWMEVGESEVQTHDTATGIRTKKIQVMWECENCGAKTIIAKGLNPVKQPKLYSMEPLELNGTTVWEPEIPNCEKSVIDKVMKT